LAFTLGVAATGCKKTANNNTTPAGDKDKVKYTLADSASVKAGEDATVTLKREGTDLPAQDVTVTVEGNDKVTAKAENFKAKDKEAKITLTAEAGAKGTATLKVKAGESKHDLKVTVEEKKGGDKKPAMYKLNKEAVEVAQGKEVKVTLSREGGSKKEKAVTFEIPEGAKGLTVAETKFKADEEDATFTIKAAADAKVGKYTIEIKAGDKDAGKIEVTVTKKGARLNILPGHDFFADARRLEVIPQFRVSIPRQVALFTRES